MTPGFVGQPLKRLEDHRLLRGEAAFLDDLRLPGVHHVAFVRSIHAHARFRVDPSAVLALPGVVGVFGAKDFATSSGLREIPTVVDHAHLRPCRQPVLAGDTVRYVGDPIVAVVAASRYVAEDGAAAVAVAYEPLDAVPDAESAMAEDAALLHQPLGDNIAADFTVQVGDVDAALRTAEVVTRGRYYVHRHTGMPLETRGVVAHYDAGTGSLTLWSSTQWPHTLRDVLREFLGLAEHKVRVVAPDVGGGFGVKQDIYPEELVLALLAMRLRAPVKWIETRREHLTGTAHAREQWADVELAARRDGTIVALSAELLADMGAYTRSLGVLCPSISAASHDRSLSDSELSMPGARGPHLQGARGRLPRGRHARGGLRAGAGHRSPRARASDRPRRASPQELHPARRVSVEARDGIGPDSAGLRQRRLRGWPRHRAGPGALRGAAERADGRAREGGSGRLLGIGVAAYVLLTGLGPYEGAVLRVDATGQVLLITGALPHGQGTGTALAQVVADELGLQPADITVQHGDTALIPFGVGTYASRNAVVAGSAALCAARAVAAKARRLAAHLLEVGEADLELVDGSVRVAGAPDRRLSLGQLAQAAAPGLPLPAGMEPGLEAMHYFPAPHATFGSGVHIAVVSVDRETGQIEIVDYAVVSDAGRLINPLIVEGQLHGGVAQGVSGALWEELVYDDSVSRACSRCWSTSCHPPSRCPPCASPIA